VFTDFPAGRRTPLNADLLGGRAMVPNNQVRKLALAFPEAYEEVHWDEPSFRVGKRIFAVLHAGDRRVVLKLPLDCQELLIDTEPQIYSARRFKHQGWTHVCLKAVPMAHFRQYLEIAWREVAPQRAIRKFEE
jgi:hypothetical protein